MTAVFFKAQSGDKGSQIVTFRFGANYNIIGKTEAQEVGDARLLVDTNRLGTTSDPGTFVGEDAL